MAEVEPEALADVAYGLFELSLNEELRAGGHYLFQLVEHHADFKEQFSAIFSRFMEKYPQLAGSLLAKFGSVDAIYEMISGGEGVIPSKTTQMYWIIQDAPDTRPDAIDDELAGKWLIFLTADKVDEAWRHVRDATCARTLGISAKVKHGKAKPGFQRPDESDLCVYRRLAGRS